VRIAARDGVGTCVFLKCAPPVVGKPLSAVKSKLRKLLRCNNFEDAAFKSAHVRD